MAILCPKCVQSLDTINCSWTHFGNMAKMFPKIGHIMDTIGQNWTSFGHGLDTFLFGRVLDTLQTHYGHILDIFLEKVSKMCPYTHC